MPETPTFPPEIADECRAVMDWLAAHPGVDRFGIRRIFAELPDVDVVDFCVALFCLGDGGILRHGYFLVRPDGEAEPQFYTRIEDIPDRGPGWDVATACEVVEPRGIE
jgi:hypothetical protein